MATILYVEDHPPAQLLMQAIIGEMTTHTLLLASSGAEAQQVAAELRPDLYILDLDLPDGDGLSLAPILTGTHPAPVILVSAYAEAVSEITLDYIYLAKPLDPDNVARTIKRSLAG
ncbi:MAG: response regulator [Chloroflexi bacterium]|nr:response regulator [Chloroflexota bacterium]